MVFRGEGGWGLIPLSDLLNNFSNLFSRKYLASKCIGYFQYLANRIAKCPMNMNKHQYEQQVGIVCLCQNVVVFSEIPEG